MECPLPKEAADGLSLRSLPKNFDQSCARIFDEFSLSTETFHQPDKDFPQKVR